MKKGIDSPTTAVKRKKKKPLSEQQPSPELSERERVIIDNDVRDLNSCADPALNVLAGDSRHEARKLFVVLANCHAREQVEAIANFATEIANRCSIDRDKAALNSYLQPALKTFAGKSLYEGMKLFQALGKCYTKEQVAAIRDFAAKIAALEPNPATGEARTNEDIAGMAEEIGAMTGQIVK